MSLVKLEDVKIPLFEVELPGGERKSYDLYELGERLGKVMSGSDDGGEFASQYDELRKVFEFPTAEEAKAAEPGTPGAFTLSRVQCQYLQTAVLDQISKRPERVRFFAILRSYSGSTESSPAR